MTKQLTLALLFSCLITAISPLPTLAAEVPGGAANSANNGLASATDDGTVYYLDLAGDIYAGGREKLYRQSPGQTAPQAVNEDEAWNLTISGKYLYYSNWSDNHYIYRMDLTNGEKQRLGTHPANQLNLAGNSLVYIKWSNSRSVLDNTIYRLDLGSGAAPRQLGSDPAENLCVAGDWVYYLNIADNYRMYKMKLDGSNRSKIADDQVIFMAVAGNTIYYSNYSDGQKLYAMGTDGSQRRKLTDDQAGFINIADGYIYYTNASANHALYRITTEGKNRRLIRDLGAGPQPITLVNGSLYYNRLFFRP